MSERKEITIKLEMNIVYEIDESKISVEEICKQILYKVNKEAQYGMLSAGQYGEVASWKSNAKLKE